MKNLKSAFLLLSTISITISACKKEKVPENEENEDVAITTNEYYPVSIGSYWVYEFDTHLPDGTINDNNDIDTLKIIGDTLIGGETHFVFHTNKPTYDSKFYRRIENGEVVSNNGALVCPPDNSYSGIYNEHYAISGNDTTYRYWEEFSGYETITTNFGETHDCIQKTVYHQIWPEVGGQLTADTLYYSPIGMLQRGFSYYTGAKQVGTLVDYHIE